MPGLHELKPAPRSKKPRTRVGRGRGSGRGAYSGRGSKGQKAKENLPTVFEGGQLPLVKRLPFMRGFTNLFRTEYSPVNVESLGLFEDGADVTPELLVERRLVRRRRDKVKILGGGELSRSLKVSAHAFSKTARHKIESAGGTATLLAVRSGEPD
jgi:large subunit ribosomal protein L15